LLQARIPNNNTLNPPPYPNHHDDSPNEIYPANVDSIYSNQYPSSSSSSSSSSQPHNQQSEVIKLKDDDQSKGKGSSSKLSVMDEIRKMKNSQ
jgi:hypothetical protein